MVLTIPTWDTGLKTIKINLTDKSFSVAVEKAIIIEYCNSTVDVIKII